MGIEKETILESGVVSKFIRIENLHFDIHSKNINYLLGYYLDKNAYESGFKPIKTEEFYLDSGFVNQYEAQRSIDIELILYTLLNNSLQGKVV